MKYSVLKIEEFVIDEQTPDLAERVVAQNKFMAGERRQTYIIARPFVDSANWANVGRYMVPRGGERKEEHDDVA